MAGIRALAQQATTWGLDPAQIVGVSDPYAAWVVREIAAWAKAYPDDKKRNALLGRGGRL
jgi:hypothetical protein